VPDLGPLRYVPSPGVPGVRVTVRRTDYAQEWTTAESVSIGLVCRAHHWFRRCLVLLPEPRALRQRTGARPELWPAQPSQGTERISGAWPPSTGGVQIVRFSRIAS
jgi:hypothetical protein